MANENEFRTGLELRIWVSFAGEALNGQLSHDGYATYTRAAEHADALLVEYRKRLPPNPKKTERSR